MIPHINYNRYFIDNNNDLGCCVTNEHSAIYNVQFKLYRGCLSLPLSGIVLRVSH